MGVRPSRRAALSLAVGVSVGSAVGAAGWLAAKNTAEPTKAKTPPSPSPAAPLRPERHLQIVAHPDDDLFFMCPDAHQSLRTVDTTTIVLTVGEDDGRNAGPGNPDFANTPVDHVGYAAARQAGLRAAYANMAIGDANAKWRREALRTAAGIDAELATLVAKPTVKLIFLNMWQEGARSPSKQAARLRNMWTGKTKSQPTMRPTGSPAKQTGAYLRQSLLDSLTGLLDRFAPTLIRIQDVDPDYQSHASAPVHADFGDFSDHQDHTAGAIFALAAVQTWAAKDHQTLVESYRGYYNERWPANLSHDADRDKINNLAIYGWADGRRCGEPTGCGDRKVGENTNFTWAAAQHYRHPADPNWLRADAEGRLQAVAVLAGRAARWRETDQGWSGPEFQSEGWLAPRLSQAPKAGGPLIAGVRMNLAPQQREVIVLDGSTMDNLGNPASGEDQRRRLGAATLAASADTVVALARSYQGRVWSRTRTGTSWTPWRQLPGDLEVADGLATVTEPDGTIAVYASGHARTIGWRAGRDGVFHQADLGVDTGPPAGPPSAAILPGGETLLVVREPRTTTVRGWVSRGGRTTSLDLGSPGGFGPTAIAAAPPGLALATRGADGRATISWRRPNGASLGGWSEWKSAGPPVSGAPSLAFDRAGRLVAGVLGLDGTLWIARVAHPGDPIEFSRT